MELLFQESAPIPTHAMAAMAAVILGGLQLASAKGTTQHRVLGWSWVLLMMYVSVSSFFISSLRLWGAFSPIHLLSVWTLFSLGMAIYHARKDNIRQHKIWMVLLYVLALLVTGVFTLWPGRVMHAVLFGA
tara:strand:- start:1423 stop:1815 length:393 start_codon:yes stop_codon:yes gene_type:complete